MNQRSFLIFCFSILISFSVHSQDSLFFTDGQIIIVKILEIESSQIKYKKFSNIDGPTYNIEKNKIKEIKYKNGDVEAYATGTENSSKKQSDLNSTAKGNKAFIKCENTEIKGLEDEFKNELEIWNYWQIVPKIEDADFILELATVKKGGDAWTFGKRIISKAIVRDLSGKIIWESKEYTGRPSAFNGYNSLSSSTTKLVDALKKEYK